jgi:hypothetical protein
MVSNAEKKVRIRCDAFINLVKELNEQPSLKEIFGSSVCEHLIVAADKGDLRLEEGGTFDLSPEERGNFLGVLQGFVGGKGQDRPGGEGTEERVRIRCDIFSQIINDLCASEEIKSLFGGNPLEFLYVVADGNDLRIEGGEELTLSEDQNTIFLKILEEIIEDNTGS